MCRSCTRIYITNIMYSTSMQCSRIFQCTILPVLGGDDSTVVGIIFWSPTSGARVGGYLQSECVSQKQGKFCS